MFRNYLKVALRNLFKHKGHALICLLIVIFVKDELSDDRFHEKRDAIFGLIIEETKPDGSVRYRRLIPLGIPGLGQKEFPAVEKVTQLAAGSATLVRNGEPFREPPIARPPERT